MSSIDRASTGDTAPARDGPVDGELSPIKRALLEIRTLRSQLGRAEAVWHEPIAIIGMGMRLPGGVSDAATLEQLLWSGTDAVTEIPPERWSLDELYDADPDAPGKMITRHGAFVTGVDRFDAEFFGISPREAASMDPQQRLLLQVAWEALEDGGHAGADLAGSRTGVFVGIANNDYGRALYAHPRSIDPYFGTGNAFSVAAGRLSYFLGVNGPSIAVDTACSSSLVALHLACQSLRLRECDLALAGGVNLILTPEMNINFSKARMMAPDGRCKTFDAAADGYVRGEGCGILLLRRLSEAMADGDRVLAVVRGSAVNQDGRSGGLTAPNGPSQEAVIRAALGSAEVAPELVSYLEAHGTGTPLGDPIEVGAIGAALCAGRGKEQPLLIGSLKTNLGHLEAAAGIAGVMKVVVSLRRREIPPHLHFKRGNPHIDWSSLPIDVPTAVRPWMPRQGRRIAGVSSFGFSGTNAHVILEEAPEAATAASAGSDSARGPERPLHLLALSARDPRALAELATRLQSSLIEGPAADVCYSASVGRAHFACRLAVTGATAEELRSGLSAYVAGESRDALDCGEAHGGKRPCIAFLFTGQGAQYPGMGRRLYQTSPVFRDALDEFARVLEPHLERGLLELIFAPEQEALIHSTRHAQPALFALEMALVRLWRSWGIEPAAVMGHSLGEYAAACTAGVLSVEDGLRLVAERGRLSEELALEGAMGAVFAPEDRIVEVLSRESELTVAAYNGPEHFVLSGPRRPLEQALGRLETAGVRVKRLKVSLAAHSRQIDPVLPALRAALESVRFAAPRVPLISNQSGKQVDARELARAEYWIEHMRRPVRFADSIRALAARGITHCIEIGPHPVLLGMGAECLPGGTCEWLPSLHRERPDWPDLLASLRRLYVGGADVDWKGFDRGYTRRRLALPTYPFRERRHWMEIASPAEVTSVDATGRWTRVRDAVRSQSEQGPLDLNASTYAAKWDCLVRLTTAHAVRTLREAGLFMRAGERRTLPEVISAAGIPETYRHLIQRWLDRLVGRGMLRAREGSYECERPLPAPDLASLWAEAERLLADNRPLLAYVRHCGDLVSAVIRGEESPLETLFPGGSFELAENLYTRSSTMRYINEIAAAAFRALAAATPAHRKLSVLEVGAGTGGTSASLLPALVPERTRYVFSDVSDFFLDRARARFAAYPFVEYRRFDIERDPAEQGYPPESFDVIVAANAVHACSDLRRALERIRSMLAPGGVLVLVESTTHLDWFDMTTGLIEGWQRFADDLRTDQPLLAPRTWVDALGAAGFSDALAYPEEGSIAAELGQHVIVARVPGELDRGPAVGSQTEDADSTSSGSRPISAAARSAAEAARLRQDVLDSPPGDRLSLLRDFVRERVVRVLKLDPNEPPGRDERLMDLGFDSLMAVQLRNDLSQGLALERPLPASVMFDHPTIEALATHLLERLVPPGSPEESRQSSSASSASAAPVLGAEAVAAMSEAEIEELLLERLGKT
jgi:acyl transferase domain-containing protein/SAM-dependent methyltransferase